MHSGQLFLAPVEQEFSTWPGRFSKVEELFVSRGALDDPEVCRPKLHGSGPQGRLCHLDPAEFSLTQMLDRPVHGRRFFEQVIGENRPCAPDDHQQHL